MKRFEGKHVLVTGGASGIGKATVRRFAAEGANVSIIDKDISGSIDFIEEVGLIPDRYYLHEADVTKPDQLSQAISAAVAKLGELNILFANAGIGGGDIISRMTIEQWDRVIQTNLNGIFYTCKHSIPSLIKAPGNTIVTMASSMAGWDTSLSGAAYMASKEGVTGLTKSLALQLGRYGVRVNAVCPGVINTPLGGHDPKTRRARYEQFAKRIPLRRVGLPEDVAGTVAFLASNDARHITGSMLLIDGGQTLQSWSNAPDQDAFPLDFDPGNLELDSTTI